MTSPADGRDFSVTAVRALVDAFVEEMPGWHEGKGRPSTILEIGGSEDQLALAVRKGVVTFETISRGHRHLEAEFANEIDGWRCLIIQLGRSWRWARDLPKIDHRMPAPGTTLERVPTGHRLRWPGGDATFYSEFEAFDFSWIASAAPADIAASYRHVNGEPLFDLGVEPWTWPPPQPPRPRRIMAPPRIETPPPDDLTAADLAVIDGFAATIGWSRRPAEGAEILVVTQPLIGRAISYRRGQFVYEHPEPDRDDRSVICSFSTAVAARRFLLADLGSILRLRRRDLPAINPKTPGPLCTVEKGPTSIVVTSPAGEGNFKLGYIGHQQALVFSWVATEDLADIAASFQHPDGNPIFQIGVNAFSPSPKLRPSFTDTLPIVTADVPFIVTPDADLDLPRDLVVIDEFIDRSMLWSRRTSIDPLVVDVADYDAQWVLSRGESGYVVEYRKQGSRIVHGMFSSARGARRYVIKCLGGLWRQSHGLNPILPKQPAQGTQLQRLPDGYRLTWAGGMAQFGNGADALGFSWIATAELADIAASYSHPNGEPLFNLDRRR